MHGLLRCNINTGVHTRVRRADVSLRDVTIARDEKRGHRLRMTSRTGSARRILGIWRKLGKLRLDTKRDGWLSLARRDLCSGCHTRWRWGGADEKAGIETLCLSLSPYVEKSLNSKVIKSFVPELRCRYVFFAFRDSYVLSLWTFDVGFTHSHIMAMVQQDDQQWMIGRGGERGSGISVLIAQHDDEDCSQMISSIPIQIIYK